MTQYYEVTQGPLTLTPGSVVRLTDEQIKLREHALKKRKDGAYDVVQTVQFKKGETIGFDNIPDKAVLAAFFPVEQLTALQQENKESVTPPASNNTTDNRPPSGQKPSAHSNKSGKG